MAFKDDLVKNGVFINEANVLSAHDIQSQLTTTQLGAMVTTTIAALTTTDIPSMTTTQVGVLNSHLASLVAVNTVIKAMS